MAKALGGGLPIAAVAGKTEVMDAVGAGKVMHVGTMNANPVGLAACKATIEVLEGGALRTIAGLGRKLIKGIQDIIADKRVQGYGSVFSIFFTNMQEIRDYRDFLKVDKEKNLDLSRKLLKEGVLVWPPAYGHWFVSGAHTSEDIDRTLEAMSRVLP
jgi:glutamate-1-semialdehyde 2,1-aminomutase